MNMLLKAFAALTVAGAASLSFATRADARPRLRRVVVRPWIKPVHRPGYRWVRIGPRRYYRPLLPVTVSPTVVTTDTPVTTVPAYVATDAQIHARVLRMLAAKFPGLVRDLKLAVGRGEVEIDGEVSDRVVRARIIAAIWAIPGVCGVENDLKID